MKKTSPPELVEIFYAHSNLKTSVLFQVPLHSNLTHSLRDKRIEYAEFEELSGWYVNKPEVYRGKCTKEDLGLACVHFIVYPVHHSFYGPLICMFYLHPHFYLCAFLKVTTPVQSIKYNKVEG